MIASLTRCLAVVIEHLNVKALVVQNGHVTRDVMFCQQELSQHYWCRDSKVGREENRAEINLQ